MSTYELDDELVRAYLAYSEPVRSDAEATIVRALSDQLPQPLPTKFGAIIQDTKAPHRAYLLADANARILQWMRRDDAEWTETTDLPRHFTVISEGVDL